MKNSTVFQQIYLSMSKGIPAAKEDTRHHQTSATWSILSNVASSFIHAPAPGQGGVPRGQGGGCLPPTLQRLGREGCHVGKGDEKNNDAHTITKYGCLVFGQTPK